MRWSDANEVVERLRVDTRLYLPALTLRRGFSSSRVEHLLQQLVMVMPSRERYLEVGTLEGRTIEAAACGNHGKVLHSCDPGAKYDSIPMDLPSNVMFHPSRWEDVISGLSQVGCVFYDADHSAPETLRFMRELPEFLADEAVLVLDDWDRATVRAGAFSASNEDPRWVLLREMPEYTDGVTAAPNHFGWYFGVAVWGFRRC
jgi:hypothetical protein